jgi:Holliday junction resolvasome RuvABC endonuclease subunit
MRVLGIDLGIRKIAVAALQDEDLIHAEAFEVGAELPRDLQLRSLGAYAHDAAQLANADSVWIEDVIIGNNRKYSIRLAQTLGAVMTHLSSMRLQAGTDIRLVDNKAWKRTVVGNGNADKDTVQNYIRESHSAYAPLCGDDQDLYDAACIGRYGVTILDRAEDLHL